MYHKLPYQITNQFSKLILDYLNEDRKLKPFINYFPKLKNFEKQIAEKQIHQIDRSILVQVLEEQNQYLNLSRSSKKNIDLLRLDTTFSVTTGHQLCLFTGPLYFIYKIISSINLCEQLAAEFPANNFIPIFWMATEDHDLNEINHIYLFGKKIEWNTKQNGAVGKMNLDGFRSVIAELKLLIGSDKNADKLISFFENAYLNHDNLADATRYLVNELFGEYGLVIIDGNDKNLKKKFIPQIKKDVLENGFVDTIKKCSNSLAKNYKDQAFVRKINFFKLSEGVRELIKSGVNKSDIESFPDRFSPNVLLRPLYQEIVLPNIAYVGGGAEIAYWMQLKTAFEQEEIPFPILVLRNSALLISQKQQQKFEKLGFRLEDLFAPKDVLNKSYILAHAHLDITLEKERRDLALLYQNIALKSLDLGFRNSIQAQLIKQLSFLDGIQEKLIRIEKKRSEVSINQIEKMKNQLFPNNELQERYDNFIPYYLKDGDNFIKILKNNFDPLSANFVVLTLTD